jgi:serine/threonine protein kinase
MEEIKNQIKDEKNLKFLGQGQFGKVYKLEFQGKDYAIKKISKDKLENNKDPELGEYLKIALKREIDILTKMSEFENSVKFYGYFTDDKDYILVLEYCDSDLQKLLKEKQKFSSSEIRTLMEGLNKPFKYMHNNGILHRDIKPENIMIKYVDSSKTKYIPKIADYGISRELDNGKATTNVGSPRYMSPQL